MSENNALSHVSREALRRARHVLHRTSVALVPDFDDLDLMSETDRQRSDVASDLIIVAAALLGYEREASGEAQIDEELAQIELPPSGRLDVLETRTITEWHDLLEARQARRRRVIAAGLDEGGQLGAHFEAMVAEAEAGFAWQRARRLRAIADGDT